MKLSTLIANEAIDFQTSSKFASELTTVMQNGIDEFNRLRSHKDDVDHVVPGIMKYASKQMFDELRKVVLTHTNIQIDRVQCDLWGGKKPYPKGYFAISISLGNARALLSKMATAHGYSDIYKQPVTYRDVAAIESAADVFSSSSNKLKATTFGKSNQRISGELFFDPVYAFCLSYYSPSDAFKVPTAEELAALVLHEIGHVHTIVECAADAYCQYDRISTAVLKMQPESSGVDELDVLTKGMSAKLDKLTKDSMLKADESDMITKAIHGVTAMIAERSDYIEEGTGGKFEDTLHVLTRSVFTIILMLLYRLSMLYTINQTLADLDNNKWMHDITSSTKYGDSLSTLHNLHRIERLADEYVSRNGKSAAMASILVKLTEFRQLNGLISDIPCTTELRRNNTIANILRFTKGVVGVLEFDKVDTKGYEAFENRIQRLSQNTIKVFKDSGLPKSVVQEYIRDYEAATKVSNAAISLPSTSTVIKLLKAFVTTVSLPSKFFRVIVNGNIRNDYKELLDTVDKLNASRLYYQSAKFRSMK